MLFCYYITNWSYLFYIYYIILIYLSKYYAIYCGEKASPNEKKEENQDKTTTYMYIILYLEILVQQ